MASGAGDLDDIERARRESQGLGLFVRSLVGLDREAATEAFSEFLTGTTLSVFKIRFVQLIVEDLTTNGVMEPSRLFEAPFTDAVPSGPAALFPEHHVDRIADILDQVRSHAEAPRTVASSSEPDSAPADQTVLIGEHHDLDPIAQAQFSQDSPDVGLHR